MADILHVLNGDVTAEAFGQTALPGDILVWREVLSEGPLAAKLDANFWHARQAWISQMFEDKPERYQELVLQELGKLNEPYPEVNLWFEYDLHCQMNLLGVMQLLHQQTNLSERTVYLTCPDAPIGAINYKSFGELDAAQLEDVFDNRVQLTDYDFILAAEAWLVCVHSDAAAMQQWFNQVPFWGNLPLLQSALQAHIKRMQVDAQGLSYIEQKLLHLYQNGVRQRAAIYHSFWNESSIYCMGDMELDIYLKGLENKGLINLED
ncbi:DUF1835 domain-containing protein [Mucilaginibacter robiniae]|uniref:DUF1835 domain-containing protein n=1 Tax=Mucilaginibacter robiniae TaxID=2728022 RepID=A0A7L5E3I9_9SPHI|nr:DUF1835 domain-containing protein [Mucilaginibacter robiniae]QJD95333.1 DUF1835 domain-containing protein [Mucilaginibacter robiniae]